MASAYFGADGISIPISAYYTLAASSVELRSFEVIYLLI